MRAAKIVAFYERVGLGDRVFQLESRNDLGWEARGRRQGKKDYVEANRELAESSKDGSLVESVYCSTSFVMKHIEDRGLSAVRRNLQTVFEQAFAEREPELCQTIRARVQEFPSDLLLVNGRFASYKREHNLSEALWSHLSAFGKPIRIMTLDPRDAWAETSQWTHQIDRSKWIEFGRWSPLLVDASGFVNREALAFFWKAVAARADIRVVGGRSGSLDIAAFMGVPTLSWDSFSPADPECIRLAIMAPWLTAVLPLEMAALESPVPHVMLSSTGRLNAKRDMTPLELLRVFVFDGAVFVPDALRCDIQEGITAVGMAPRRGIGSWYSDGPEAVVPT